MDAYYSGNETTQIKKRLNIINRYSTRVVKIQSSDQATSVAFFDFLYKYELKMFLFANRNCLSALINLV